MRQGIFSFAGLNNLGGRMTVTRGIRPSVAHIICQPQQRYDRVSGTLQLNYDGKSVAFPGSVAAGPVYYHKRDRDLHRWSLHVYDRRWKWRYPRIDGVYNERDATGNLQTLGKKNIKQLMELCLTALGETSAVTSSVPADVYPPVKWNRAKAALELEWLCDLVGMTVVLGLNNVVSIVPVNDTGGSQLPNLPVLTEPDHSWKMTHIPSTVRVQGDPTIIQSALALEPVAPDTDGTIKPLGSLSYRPAAGWDWPEFFSAVQQQQRHLAHKYVFRWFRPIGGWDGDGVTINSHEQLEFLDYLAETGTASSLERPLPPVVRGNYWPGCELGISTDEATFDGEFRILRDIGVVEFDRPVFRIGNNEVIEPDIELVCAYRVRKTDQDGYSVYTKDLTVSASNQTTQPMVLNHPELTKVKVVDSAYPAGLPASDNEIEISAEADRYLAQIEQTFDYTQSEERHYAGFLGSTEVNLDGAISQIEWIHGDGMLTTTRVGRFNEFDLKTIQHRQARALHRLSQMAERQSL